MKEALKIWFVDFQEKQKRSERELLDEIERWDSLAELGQISECENDLRTSLKSGLMIIYKLEEICLIQKSKLHWLKTGDETRVSFIDFWRQGNKRI